jgi:hypothetical protein
MNKPRFGINEYYHKHNTPESGNSYFTLGSRALINRVIEDWSKRIPGAGEGDCLDRKVLVPILSNGIGFRCPRRAKMVEGMPVQAKIEARQAGERPSVSTYVRYEDAVKHDALYQPEATDIKVVLYSREALLENGDHPTTNADWEIITLLCSDGKQEPMHPLTMARNQLEKDGGTYSEYSALEYAEAIWFHSIEKDLKVRR